MLRKIAVVVLCGLLLPVLASAQAVRATVFGSVKDASSGVLPGVTITVTNVETAAPRVATTDATGQYQVQGLAPGRYRISAELEGFKTIVLEGVELVVGQEARFDVTLELGQLQETLTVTSEAPLIDTTGAAVTGIVGSEQIRELPLNGRSFTELALLQPGAVNSTTSMRGSGVFGGKGVKIAVNGANIWSNQWLLDGTSINDSYNKTPGSIAGVLLGVDTVREFKTYTSTYGAELGGMGGVIDAVTKSGTNDAHGNVFAFFRDSSLDARNFFDVRTEPPPFNRQQYGATFGGPIRRGRTFFFAGFEGLRERLSSTRIYVVPDEASRRGVLGNPANPAQPILVSVDPSVQRYLALYPLPNGRLFGDGRGELTEVVEQPTDEKYFSLRLDHTLSATDTVFGRFTVDRGEDVVSNPSRLSIFPETEKSNNRYFTLEENKVFSSSLLNRARIGINRSELSSANTPTIDLPDSLRFLPDRTFANANIGITGLTSLGGNTIQPIQQVQTLVQVSDDVTYTRGMHTVKAGADYRRYKWDTDQDFHQGGTWTFRDLRSFLTNAATSFQIKLPGSTTDRLYRQWTLAGYLQDDIQLSSRLTLNVGVRYEMTSPPREKNDRIADLTDPLNQGVADFVVGELWPDNSGLRTFSPRVGFAWNPDGNGRLAIRGGAGMYREPILEDKYDTWRLSAPFYSFGVVNFPAFPNALGGVARLNVRDFESDITSPMMVRYSLIVERQIGDNAAVSVGYVGAQGRYLWRAGEVNNPPARTLADGRLFFPANTPRVNPTFNTITMRATDGNSMYDSLQLSFNQRGKNRQFQVSYTWGKSIDDASAIHGNDSLTEQSSVQYYKDRTSNRGPSGFDVRHTFRTNYSYTLPSVGSGMLGHVFGNWQLGGILTLASGSPFTIRAPGLPTGFLFGAQRVNLKPGASNNPILGGPDRYVDPAAFELPPPGTLGNLGRNTLVGPGLVDLSLALIKHIPVGGTRMIELRAEAFNALNHANFGTPNAVIFDPTGAVLADAGRIRQTVTPSRQIQFGLKFNF